MAPGFGVREQVSLTESSALSPAFHVAYMHLIPPHLLVFLTTSNYVPPGIPRKTEPAPVERNCCHSPESFTPAPARPLGRAWLTVYVQVRRDGRGMGGGGRSDGWSQFIRFGLLLSSIPDSAQSLLYRETCRTLRTSVPPASLYRCVPFAPDSPPIRVGLPRAGHHDFPVHLERFPPFTAGHIESFNGLATPFSHSYASIHMRAPPHVCRFMRLPRPSLHTGPR